ncbi:kinase-like domain-containing protein [Blastocladiella britannica]|nr:kinase-like domain-containing protein [Blastocladiella britannica]
MGQGQSNHGRRSSTSDTGTSAGQAPTRKPSFGSSSWRRNHSFLVLSPTSSPPEDARQVEDGTALSSRPRKDSAIVLPSAPPRTRHASESATEPLSPPPLESFDFAEPGPSQPPRRRGSYRNRNHSYNSHSMPTTATTTTTTTRASSPLQEQRHSDPIGSDRYLVSKLVGSSPSSPFGVMHLVAEDQANSGAVVAVRVVQTPPVASSNSPGRSAVPQPPQYEPALMAEVLGEISFMHRAQPHPAILGYCDAFLHDEAISSTVSDDVVHIGLPSPAGVWLISPWMSGGPLTWHLPALHAAASLDVLAAVLGPVANALDHLHTVQRMVHGDVRARRILVCARTGSVKLQLRAAAAVPILGAGYVASVPPRLPAEWMAPEVARAALESMRPVSAATTHSSSHGSGGSTSSGNCELAGAPIDVFALGITACELAVYEARALVPSSAPSRSSITATSPGDAVVDLSSSMLSLSLDDDKPGDAPQPLARRRRAVLEHEALCRAASGDLASDLVVAVRDSCSAPLRAILLPLVLSCLAEDPGARPAAAELLESSEVLRRYAARICSSSFFAAVYSVRHSGMSLHPEDHISQH